ncbi:hypothetical protein V1478_015530, partial [Vespula squamosa]
MISEDTDKYAVRKRTRRGKWHARLPLARATLLKARPSSLSVQQAEGSLRSDEHIESLYRNFIETNEKDNIYISIDLNNNEKTFKEGTYSIRANKYSNVKTEKCCN